MNDEFDLIDGMLDVLGDAAAGPSVVVGPKDDAAVLRNAAGCELVVSTDTLVADRHYPASAEAALIGYRSLAVATSDLAAMGAQPAWATVALTSVGLTMAWAQAFAAGVRAAAVDFGLAVVGGNVARGPSSVTVTVAGHVPSGRALLRSGAAPGDEIYVTGCLGGARLALTDADLADCRFGDLAPDSPLHRYWKPRPRIGVGTGLRGIASAAIDISDGLSSELAHLCQASGLAASVVLDNVPVFSGCSHLQAATGGDDYELAFTVPPAKAASVPAVATATGVPCTLIGVMREGPANTRWTSAGTPIDVPQGYRHF